MTESKFPPRVWVNPRRPVAAWPCEEGPSHVEYLSLIEHEALLKEARAKAAAKEALTLIGKEEK